MAANREVKREELRLRMIDAARERIVIGGVRSLRARDVTADVGTALGGLYNTFADLDDLIIHVNSATLARLKQSLEARMAAIDTPRAALTALAIGYLDFARENHALWSALFEHRFASEDAVPDWHLAEQDALLMSIIGPLGLLHPDLDRAMLTLRARTLFGAIHGIVATSLEKRFIGVQADDLELEIVQFVDVIVKGMAVQGKIISPDAKI